jgi:transcriptional regulator with XRE-family HTH domain
MTTAYWSACREGNSYVECLGVKQSGAREWSVNWTRLIGENVRSIRKARKLSTQTLSEICTERVGYAVPRNAIVNLETGRKESLSVQELVAIALALDTPPVMLLYPLDRDVDIAPGEPRNPLHAIEWFAGKWNADTASEITGSDRLVAPQLQTLRNYVKNVDLAKQLAALIDALAGNPEAADTRKGAEEDLERTVKQMLILRDNLQQQDIQPPELPGLDAVTRRARPLTIETIERKKE